jgi:hypothetical protein
MCTFSSCGSGAIAQFPPLQVNETAGGGFSISINFCSTLCTSIFQVPSEFHILPAEKDAELPWMCGMCGMSARESYPRARPDRLTCSLRPSLVPGTGHWQLLWQSDM